MFWQRLNSYPSRRDNSVDQAIGVHLTPSGASFSKAVITRGCFATGPGVLRTPWSFASLVAGGSPQNGNSGVDSGSSRRRLRYFRYHGPHSHRSTCPICCKNPISDGVLSKNSSDDSTPVVRKNTISPKRPRANTRDASRPAPSGRVRLLVRPNDAEIAHWRAAPPLQVDQEHPDPTPCAGAPHCNGSPTLSAAIASAIPIMESTSPGTRVGSFRSPVRRLHLPSGFAAAT